MKATTHFPRARTKSLIVEEMTDELLVYDLDRDKAHCLNPVAAAVWKHCNGHTSAAQIAKQLIRQCGGETGRSIANANTLTDQVVWLALEQLSRDHLLEDRLSWPTHIPRISRREAIRRLGIGAAIAVPIVASITAPTAVQAGTCRTAGQNCGTGSQCCSGICSNNTCT
jgi:hypothetical protein